MLKTLTSAICVLTITGSIFARDNLCIDDSNMPRWYMLTCGLCLLVATVSVACLMRKENALRPIRRSICLWIVAACFLQSVLFLLQALRIVEKANSFCAGSFDNSSGLAACLVVSIPVGMKMYSFYSRKQKMAFLVFKATTLMVLIIIKSRLGIICMVATALLFVKVKRIVMYSLLVASVVAATFLLKTDSSKGRFFIYERALEMITRHPLVGWGYKGFERHYMSQQAYYFSNNRDSQYSNLADNIHHPLCEVLQVGVDGGIAGLGFLCFVILVIHRETKKMQDGGETTACLVCIGICSLFSYPLHFPFTWVVMAYALVPILKTRWRALACMPSLVLALVIFICATNAWHTEYKWWKLAQKANCAVSTRDLGEYEALFLKKQSSPYFLFNYSAVLCRIGNYEKAYEMAKKCFEVFNDYEVCLLLGDICVKLGKYNECLSWYKLAHNMVPSRIIPLYRAFCAYRDFDNINMALKMGKEIYTFKPKVASDIVEEIKYDVVCYLKQHEE